MKIFQEFVDFRVWSFPLNAGSKCNEIPKG